MAIGEIGYWLRQAGGAADVDVRGAAGPFAHSLADDHLGAAAAFRRMGCPYEAARELAATGDVASLREALATFRRLGAAPAAAAVASQLRALGARVPARRASRADAPGPQRPGDLSEREVEVLRLVAAGFSNPQIATSLYISRKTAEHHVSNILAKLGVTTRTEAAAAAVRLGVVDG